MRQAHTTIAFPTSRQGLVEITPAIVDWVAAQPQKDGLLTLFCRHTSASLLIQENASADAAGDVERFFARIAPQSPSAYAHDDEGPDDMPAHLRTALTNVTLSVPLVNGRLALGTWQGIFLFEHRHGPQQREIVLHLIGE